MDVFALYERLPDDVCTHIKSYFPLWQRVGLRREPKVLQAFPSAYYAMVRRSPRGFRMNAHSYAFHHRRQRDTFQWRLSLAYGDDTTDDVWRIFMSPQWEQTPAVTCLVKKLLRHKFWTAIPLPASAAFVDAYLFDDVFIEMVFQVSRPTATSPPTTQASLEAFAEYTLALASCVRKQHA